MKQVIRHSWDLSASEAIALQNDLASTVTEQGDPDQEIRVVAGVDVSYQTETETALAAIALFRPGENRPFATQTASITNRFPYIPGLFAFRELPAICTALEACDEKIDLVICDGHGIAHPRRFGLASHLGVLFDVPTIGCAKNPHARGFEPPGTQRGQRSEILQDGKVVGACLRTQDNTKPVFVSVGHQISLDAASDWVLRLASRYRLPEPIRAADQLTRQG